MNSSEAPTGLRPDQQLGPYQISSRIGAGGMGEVYRARDTRLGRDVAVKVLPSSFAQDPGRLHRFEQEARAAAALNHPSIVASRSNAWATGARRLRRARADALRRRGPSLHRGRAFPA